MARGVNKCKRRAVITAGRSERGKRVGLYGETATGELCFDIDGSTHRVVIEVSLSWASAVSDAVRRRTRPRGGARTEDTICAVRGSAFLYCAG